MAKIKTWGMHFGCFNCKNTADKSAKILKTETGEYAIWCGKCVLSADYAVVPGAFCSLTHYVVSDSEGGMFTHYENYFSTKVFVPGEGVKTKPAFSEKCHVLVAEDSLTGNSGLKIFIPASHCKNHTCSNCSTLEPGCPSVAYMDKESAYWTEINNCMKKHGDTKCWQCETHFKGECKVEPLVEWDTWIVDWKQGA